MKLRLAAPEMDKNWMLYAEDLQGDKNFKPHGGGYFRGFDDYDELKASERCQFDLCVEQVAKAMDDAREIGVVPALNLFNQSRWEGEGGGGGTSGWEYWTDRFDRIRVHALKVAIELELDIDLTDIDEWIATGRSRWARRT